MFANLLLTIAIVTGPTANPAPARSDAIATTASPFSIAGPVSVRFRTPAGMVQVAADAIRVDQLERPANGQDRAE